tara:strand:- start:1399 stop:2790 length:1392 start_codon:yes stop_codon:yes gene_type:complete
MSAIITDPFKKQLTQTIFDEVRNTTNRYYIGIGRSEPWDSSETVPTPTNSPRTIRNVRAGLQSIKSASDLSYVIPRYNWSSGSIYQGYDDDFTGIPDTNPYAVLTEDNQVYMVLQQAKNNAGTATTSTIKPTGTSTKPFKTSDGYVWKFLYTLSAARSSAFLSANFLPVEKILDSARVNDLTGTTTLSVLEIQQALVQDSAVPGQIIGIAVTGGGTGYTSAPTVTIHGDGVRAAATATISGGAVTKIELDSSTDSAMKMGQGYNFASVAITGGGGSGAAARAIIGPDSGLGADPRDDLRSTSLMFNTKPNGIEDSNFIVGQDFRQVALIRDPKKTTDDSDFTTSSGKVLKFLKLTAAANTNFLDATITGGTTGAKALVDEVDSDRLYFHQTEATGFLAFAEGEAITGGGTSGTLVAEGVDVDSDAFTKDDVDNLSGKIVYIENRAPVTRAANQQEDIKVVISL